MGRSDRDCQIRVFACLRECLSKQIQSNNSVRVNDEHLSSFIAKYLIEADQKIDLYSTFIDL